jgi:uncharacterized protein (TIGR02284 family)
MMEKELDTLLKLNLDAAEGYAYAAEEIENENFKNFLSTYAKQRQKYAAEIKEHMIESGFQVDYDTTLLGDIHKGFIKLKESMNSNSDNELVAECIRGEQESQSMYEKTLKQNTLPQHLQKMALKHLNKTRAAESTLREIHGVL